MDINVLVLERFGVVGCLFRPCSNAPSVTSLIRGKLIFSVMRYWPGRYCVPVLREVLPETPAPAGKPGRKRESCQQCFSTKRACDKGSPCHRCRQLGLPCTFEPQRTLSPADSVSRGISSLPPMHPSGSSRDSPLFSFLRHFTDPGREKDRLAIATTAECSVRRNLETLYSHIQDALIPLDSMTAWFGDLSGSGSFFSPPFSTDDFISTDFLASGPGPTKLSGQLNELMMEVVETSRSMELEGSGTMQLPLDTAQLVPLFTVSNVGIFVSVFFHSLYWHLPVVHFPTFDPGNISNPLLLSTFLTGATYSNSFDEAALLPRLLDVAEEYIFRKVTALSTQSAPPILDATSNWSTIQLIQAGLIIEMLQFGQERVETRRRIRVIRHPSLVSLMRCLGIFNLKRSKPSTVVDVDDTLWKSLIAEEVCIRLASWTFLADGFLTLCFKNRPAVSIFELDCPFPWKTGLWEAENASTFSQVAMDHEEELPLPSIREAVRLLLESPNPGPVPSRFSLSAEHLLIIIYALNSLAFMARVDFFGAVSLEKIRRAASNWKQIWDSSSNNEQKLLLGYPKHAEELWLLLTATLDIDRQRTNLPYLDTDSAATDDLGKLNQFIEWCSRYMKTPNALNRG
ncbi:Zn(II)2Cys6 transcription factor [Aspergillus foveolatus]|uniref:Zn(II)2Cys6 transcription factor n=1 Tax=Aspergillus foveolatus TaxID=210207 RepID=UPI003CCD6DF6